MERCLGGLGFGLVFFLSSVRGQDASLAPERTTSRTAISAPAVETSLLTFDEWNADSLIGNAYGRQNSNLYRNKYGLLIETCDLIGAPAVGDTIQLVRSQASFEVVGGPNQPHISPRNLLVAAGGGTRDLLLTFEEPVTSVSIVSDRYIERPDLIRMIILEPIESKSDLRNPENSSFESMNARVLAMDAKWDNAISPPSNLLSVNLQGKTFQRVLIECTAEQEAFDNLKFTRLRYRKPLDLYYSGSQSNIALRSVESLFPDYVTLLNVDKVRSELKIDTNQSSNLEMALSTFREKDSAVTLAAGKPSTVKKSLSSLHVKTAKSLEEILLPMQVKRLNEILLQQKLTEETVQTLKLDDIQQELKLTQGQIRKLNDVNKKSGLTARRLPQEMRSTAAGNTESRSSEGESVRQSVSRFQANEAALAILTDEQREKLSALTGTEFKLEVGGR